MVGGRRTRRMHAWRLVAAAAAAGHKCLLQRCPRVRPTQGFVWTALMAVWSPQTGRLVLSLTLASWLGYTLWLVHPIVAIAPPRYHAVALPVAAGVALFGTSLLTLGCFLVSGE